MTLRRLGLSALCLSLTTGGTTAVATRPTEHLPLGPANLAETRDIRTLQPGVTFHLRDAINLDGGGSTTMVADNTVLNTPSDTTGERPVGDALIITK